MPVDWQKHGTRRTYEPGEYVYRLGDPTDAVYWIMAGRVALLKDTRTEEQTLLGYRSKGDLLGESMLSGETSRAEWALVVDATEVRMMDQADFWGLIDANPDFRREMITILAANFVAADEGHLRAAAHEQDTLERFASLSGEHERMAEVMQLRQATMQFIIHDLRNPLNMIKSAVGMLESDHLPTENEQARTILLVAQRGVQRMLALVDTLLDVDRLEEGSDALNLEPTNLVKILEDVHQRIQPLAAVSDIEVALKLPAKPLPTVRVDRQCIDRVITNLIDNALKFTLPDTKVEVSAWQDESAIFVAVDDEGTGIPPEQRSRIFERFAQADPGPEGRRGFGLGLAYCKSAITAHGGKIWVEDAPGGEGMRFVFSLPVPAK